MLIIGAHMSIAGGFSQAAQRTGELGCNAMQIFTKSPRGNGMKPLVPEDVELFKKICQQYRIDHVFAHSSYLLNFAQPPDKASWMHQNILTDFERLHRLGGRGVVVHIGKALLSERQTCMKNIIENAKHIVNKTEREGLLYILENTAGQGSEIGFKLEELGQLWKGLEGFSPRIKTCLDTAHIWAAGYDISTKSGVTAMFEQYDQLIGMRNLAVIHFNDSKKCCGSHLDRHENIGEGQIGLEGLSTIAKYAEQHSIPLILETPEETKTHGDDVEIMRRFVTLR